MKLEWVSTRTKSSNEVTNRYSNQELAVERAKQGRRQ